MYCCIELNTNRGKVYKIVITFFDSQVMHGFHSTDFHETHHCLEKPYEKCSLRTPYKLCNKCGIYGYEITYDLK